jgi:ADP-ribose pyrophosphatase YjhB (NUDIX family)
VSLNPALEDVGHCPRCTAPAEVDFPRSLTCTRCGYRSYWSPEPVACAIPKTEDGRIWLLRRALHEAAGRWTFPGGFVNLGESVEQAALRETLEEIGIEVDLGRLVGVYSRASERNVMVVFEATACGTARAGDEASEVRLFAPDRLPWDELAFWSTEAALRDYTAAALASSSATAERRRTSSAAKRR